MLNSISWLQYVVALAMLITGYYSVIVSIYYRTEITSILKWKKTGERDLESKSHHGNVLGEIKNDPHESSLSSEELRFTSESPNHLTEENY